MRSCVLILFIFICPVVLKLNLTPITCEKDGLKLYSSPKTSGYIECDALCDMSSVDRVILP